MLVVVSFVCYIARWMDGIVIVSADLQNAAAGVALVVAFVGRSRQPLALQPPPSRILFFGGPYCLWGGHHLGRLASSERQLANLLVAQQQLADEPASVSLSLSLSLGT